MNPEPPVVLRPKCTSRAAGIFRTALLMTAVTAGIHSVHPAHAAEKPPEKLSERAARGTPRDRTYLHGAILTVKNWATTAADLKLAGELRGYFRKWAADSYDDLLRWIEAEQTFGPLSPDDRGWAIATLAQLNQQSGKCRIPPEIVNRSEFSAHNAAQIETELLLPCETLAPDEATQAVPAVIHPARAALRPKEVGAYFDARLKDRQMSASLCQATRAVSALLGRWNTFDGCARILGTGEPRAEFVEGAALELLNLDLHPAALKALSRPWLTPAEKKMLRGAQARILLAQGKPAAFKDVIRQILVQDPLDSPDFLWAASASSSDMVSGVLGRIEPLVTGSADDLATGTAALQALFEKHCPQATDPLSAAPDCQTGRNLSLWRSKLLLRMVSPASPYSLQRAAEELLLLLPAAAWKGTAPHVCGGAGAEEATGSLRARLAVLCRRIAGPEQAPQLALWLQTGGHAERLAILNGLAAGGTSGQLRTALRPELEHMAALESAPVSERRAALFALASDSCEATAPLSEAAAGSTDILLAEAGVRGLGCAGKHDPLAAIVTDDSREEVLRWAAFDELLRRQPELAAVAAQKAGGQFANELERRRTAPASSILRERYFDLPMQGVIYPAVRLPDRRTVFLVNNLAAEPVLKVDTGTDFGPVIAIGMENRGQDGEPAGHRVLRLYRQPAPDGDRTIYVSERYPAEFDEDGSLKRPASGGGWTEF